MVYVIYKPQQLGVYNKYTTQVQGQRKFAVDKSQTRRVRDLSNPKGEGFINGKLSMTEDKGHMFVVYTVMIYTMMKSY